jgi:hypothetical protein
MTTRLDSPAMRERSSPRTAPSPPRSPTSSFLERHIGESFEGAALLPATCSGPLVDLGSGNGYPGIPVAVACRGLVPTWWKLRPRRRRFSASAPAAAADAAR